MWAHPDVCRLVANNLGSFAVNLGYTPSIVAVNLGNSTPMIAGRTSDVCKPLHVGFRASGSALKDIFKHGEVIVFPGCRIDRVNGWFSIFPTIIGKEVR
jgi:hypothetical protein